jgi:hypothetical protein
LGRKSQKGREGRKEATRVADTLVHIASRSLSEPLTTGRAFVYALDGIISLYSCIRYVSFCTRFYRIWGHNKMFDTLLIYELLVQGSTAEMRAVFIGKNRGSRHHIGFLFRPLMVQALMPLPPPAAFNHHTRISHNLVRTHANTISIRLLKMIVCHREHSIITRVPRTSPRVLALIPSALGYAK